MIDLIIELFRFIVWAGLKFVLMILDVINLLIDAICTCSIFQFPEVMKWYILLMCFIVLFLLIRIYNMYLRQLIAEERFDTIEVNAQVIFKRIFVVIVTIVFAPIVINYLMELASMFITNIPVFLGSSNTAIDIGDFLMADLLQPAIDAGYTIDTFDINMQQNGVYLIDTTQLVLRCIMTFCIAYLSVFLVITFTKRLYDIIYTTVIAVFPISAIADVRGDTFHQWKNILLSDIMANALQYMLLMIVIIISSSNTVSSLAETVGQKNTLAGLLIPPLFLIGGYSAVLTGPTKLAQLFGNGFGANEAMQQMQSSMASMGGLRAGTKFATDAALAAAGIVGQGASGATSAGQSFGLGVRSAVNGLSSGIMGMNNPNAKGMTKVGQSVGNMARNVASGVALGATTIAQNAGSLASGSLYRGTNGMMGSQFNGFTGTSSAQSTLNSAGNAIHQASASAKGSVASAATTAGQKIQSAISNTGNAINQGVVNSLTPLSARPFDSVDAANPEAVWNASITNPARVTSLNGNGAVASQASPKKTISPSINNRNQNYKTAPISSPIDEGKNTFPHL